jgi:hypothetical protein
VAFLPRSSQAQTCSGMQTALNVGWASNGRVVIPESFQGQADLT